MGDALITPAGTPLAPIIVHRYLYIYRSLLPGHQLIFSSSSGSMPHNLGTGILEKKRHRTVSLETLQFTAFQFLYGGAPTENGAVFLLHIYIYIFSFSLSSPALWGGAHETLVLKRKGDTPDTNNCSKNFLLQASYNLMRLCMT